MRNKLADIIYKTGSKNKKICILVADISPAGSMSKFREEYPKRFNKELVKETESLSGSRGGVRESGLNIHSIRLPGLLAHQVVIMGSPGETYTIKHDTIDRKAYMPGVLESIKKIGNYETLVYGLEKLIF